MSDEKTQREDPTDKPDGWLNAEIAKAAREGVAKCVREVMGGYRSPLEELVRRQVSRTGESLSVLVGAALDDVTKSEDFRADLSAALRQKLAKVLVSKLGGEIERRVNDLKSNPATRARITLALERMIAKEIEEDPS